MSVAGGVATVTLTKARPASPPRGGEHLSINGISYQDTNTDDPTAGNRVFTLTQIKDNGGTTGGGIDTTTLSIASTVHCRAGRRHAGGA